MNNENYNGEIIQSMVRCEYSPNSPVYKINVKSINPDMSILIANTVAEAFVMEVRTLVLTDELNVQILDEAYEYKKVYDGLRDQIFSIAAFAIIGTLICIAIILIKAGNSKRVETVDDVTLCGEIEILGVIPNFDVE